MSWENETKEEIKLTSPEGNIFYALWRADERSNEKKLGIFSIPKFNGDIVQDMGVKSTQYPLTIYFEGLYHHREADEFDRACKESGQWEVIHPVKGPLILQLMSWRENINPIENGNYTEIETQWIEPANIERLISPDEYISSILSMILIAIEDAGTILSQLRTDVYGVILSTVSTINNVANKMNGIIQELTITDALLYESYLSMKAALNSALASYGIDNSDPSDVAEDISELALIPVDSSTDFSARFTAYQELADSLFTLTPEGITDEDYNKVIGQEFGITLVLIAIAKIIATSEFASRTEIISAMENIMTVFNGAIETVETIQDNFSDSKISMQYYSQIKTYTSLINLYSLTLQYLISQFYNLHVEKKIILKTVRSPIEITVTEYGELGKDDEYYDLFLNSNQLTGNEILLLNAGKEVVIYV